MELADRSRRRAAGAARPIAGGTDLLTTLKAGLHAPARLVNLKSIRRPGRHQRVRRGLHIGALVTLDMLERNALVRERYRALADAAGLAASPQLRNMGTLGGNLAQETRCWYYRNPDFPCWLKGGETCFAREGENTHHAIFTDESYCVSVHPSDPATALLALDAGVRVQGRDGERSVPIADFFTPPAADRRRLNALGPADVIAGVELAGRRGAHRQPLSEGDGPRGLVVRPGRGGRGRHLGDGTRPGAAQSKRPHRPRRRWPGPRRARRRGLPGRQGPRRGGAAEAGRLAVQAPPPLARQRTQSAAGPGLVPRALLRLAEPRGAVGDGPNPRPLPGTGRGGRGDRQPCGPVVAPTRTGRGMRG